MQENNNIHVFAISCSSSFAYLMIKQIHFFIIHVNYTRVNFVCAKGCAAQYPCIKVIILGFTKNASSDFCLLFYRVDNYSAQVFYDEAFCKNSL